MRGGEGGEPGDPVILQTTPGDRWVARRHLLRGQVLRCDRRPGRRRNLCESGNAEASEDKGKN